MTYNINDILKIADEDAKNNFFKLVTKIELNNRGNVLKDLLNLSGLGHISVTLENIPQLGKTVVNTDVSPMLIEGITLAEPDRRTQAYHLKTVFHEFYHANLHQIPSDQLKIDLDDWRILEETAAETSAHYMVRLAGFYEEIVPSYSHILIEVLPKLKQLDEFKDCKTIKDFGRRFLKYRFSELKSGNWSTLFSEISKIKLDLNIYLQPYINEIVKHKSEIIKKAFEAINDSDKESNKLLYLRLIEARINDALKNNDLNDEYYSMGLAVIMNRVGVM
jgi:hypothetical protein